MADRIRSIALATLANLSRKEEGGNNSTFSIHEIATRAAQLFTTLDYNELSNSLTTYLAAIVTSGEDRDFTGDPLTDCICSQMLDKISRPQSLLHHVLNKQRQKVYQGIVAVVALPVLVSAP